jgi:hypothetical protein
MLRAGRGAYLSYGEFHSMRRGRISCAEAHFMIGKIISCTKCISFLGGYMSKNLVLDLSMQLVFRKVFK